MRLPLALSLAVLSAAPSAQPVEEATDRLLPVLEPPALLAATAALLHDATGRFPATPFELLGSRQADSTGLRRVAFAALALQPEGDSLRVAYHLTPTDPTMRDRHGTITLSHTDPGRYAARLTLDHHDDPHFSTHRLAVTEADGLDVRRARGRLCIDLARTRAFLSSGPLDGQALFLGSEHGLAFRYTERPGPRLVGEARRVRTGG
ncbi:MAG TPA: hypothetical protein VD962_11870 [Rubricoccaceae bacterium]|nr:hypothetical protein [Rubricoccaceae bacterium]